jgi:hypothetical protein
MDVLEQLLVLSGHKKGSEPPFNWACEPRVHQQEAEVIGDDEAPARSAVTIPGREVWLYRTPRFSGIGAAEI